MKIIFLKINMLRPHGSHHKPTTSSSSKAKETEIYFNAGGKNELCIGLARTVQYAETQCVFFIGNLRDSSRVIMTTCTFCHKP